MGTNGGRFERRRSRRKKEGSLKFVDKWDLVWAMKRGSTPEQEYTSFLLSRQRPNTVSRIDWGHHSNTLVLLLPANYPKSMPGPTQIDLLSTRVDSYRHPIDTQTTPYRHPNSLVLHPFANCQNHRRD